MKTKHAFIAAHASEHAIRFMCRVLGVAHSWFHARRRVAPKRAERAARRDRVGSEIREIFEQSKRCYGAPRIHAELKARGFRISKRTVAKLMRENGIPPRHDTPAGPARTSPPDTSPRLPVRATLTEGYTRSHFGPPQPDQPAASVGDYCAAVLTSESGRCEADCGSPFPADNSSAPRLLMAACPAQ